MPTIRSQLVSIIRIHFLYKSGCPKQANGWLISRVPFLILLAFASSVSELSEFSDFVGSEFESKGVREDKFSFNSLFVANFGANACVNC